MIVGITGTNKAGKGTLVEFLNEEGFKHLSVRKFLQEELEKRGLQKDNRDEMIDLANELRATYSSDYIFKQLCLITQSEEGNWVIESLRNKGEINALRELDNSYLISIDADSKVRYERAVRDKKESDLGTFEQFIEQEEKEMFSIDPSKQNLRLCMARSDYNFINDYRTVKEAQKEFKTGKKGFLNLINGAKRRPSFDEEYMRQSDEWSLRSTCLRRFVGAVTSMNDISISQGYNGAVRGSRHCEELGCIRLDENIPSGMRLEMCRGVHAEQNAVINAGRQGRSLVGATLHCTTYPCSHCTKDIVQSGIKRVVYLEGYDNEISKEIFNEIKEKVQIEKYSGVLPHAFPRFWG